MASSQQRRVQPVHGHGKRFSDPLEVFRASYAEGVTDEFIVPSVVAAEGEEPHTIKDNDAVIYFNFRSDRGREMSSAITVLDFDHRVRSGKTDDIAALIRRGNPKLLVSEMAKCDVRCANDHRRKTAREFGYARWVARDE